MHVAVRVAECVVACVAVCDAQCVAMCVAEHDTRAGLLRQVCAVSQCMLQCVLQFTLQCVLYCVTQMRVKVCFVLNLLCRTPKKLNFENFYWSGAACHHGIFFISQLHSSSI